MAMLRHLSQFLKSGVRNSSAVAANELGSLGPSSERVFDREDKYGAHNYHPLPVALKKGKGEDY